MAYRELSMMDVKEVLLRWSAGHSDRKIGREAGVDRKTVARCGERPARAVGTCFALTECPGEELAAPPE